VADDEDRRLAKLREERASLLDEIEKIDYDLRNAERGILAGDEPGRYIQHIQERTAKQNNLFLDLGKVEQQIEDTEQLRLERDEAHDEAAAVQAWEDQYAQGDDYLDWLHQPATGSAGEAVREDKHESVTQDDDLDWLREPERDERR
jgi:hypothetical protein